MATQRTQGRRNAKLSVIVVDENLCHANTASCILANLNFQVMVYMSPIEALKFLKDHEKDIDFALVAVNMKEIHGFQFLDISRESHKNLQVIMMSDDMTWPTVKRSVELGARFLVKKPLDANSICDIWQHLDHKFLKWEKIKYLFQGVEGEWDDVFNSDKRLTGGANKQKVSQLMWTPFLQRKFLQALELLGKAATPTKIQLIMNINCIGRKQISAHLQKHRKKVEKELRNKDANNNGASSSQPLQICETDPNTCQFNPQFQPADRLDQDMYWDEKEKTDETQGKNTYEAMRRALQLGTIFDESQLPNDPPINQASKRGRMDMMGDGKCPMDWTYPFGNKNENFETHNAGNAKRVMEKGDSDSGDPQERVLKIVAYSDSEDDEAL